ncbi:MAG: hypothetical protein PHR64_00015 [Candidatus Shapirobacteria bacterium]|nr:hypothetical protein [Candidatus Shapirobacteria bacterium]MDD5073570.1 hypothetical protein [Candidatus Shapirobacteria bacterium]MDD5481323.1 hypothetical protein [Candidatus Shapirobacteria bacterium]
MTRKNFLVKAAVIFFLIFSLFASGQVEAQEKVALHLFWSYGCPHCEKEKVFLNNLKDQYPRLTIKTYEVTSDRANSILLERAGKALGINISGVPFTIIGQDYIIGYESDETSGRRIEEIIGLAIENDHEDLVGNLLSVEQSNQNEPAQIKGADAIRIPIFGDLELASLSLPLLTFVVALLDGFNPCAMWTLIFLISLLLGMKDKKRMWILGAAFIITSGVIYFLFLSAWLNLFLFLGWVAWVRILIGLIALAAGGYYLRDFWVNRGGACPVTGNKKRQKIFQKIRAVTQKKQFFLALLGIILLAVAVNAVELVCSAGLPAVYTQVLALANLPTWQYYLYLLFYVVIFMIDDLFVFFAAMITLRATGIQTKYARYSHLIGGLLMLVIGLLLLFKPELLMFG